jgi:hypothetical protein
MKYFTWIKIRLCLNTAAAKESANIMKLALFIFMMVLSSLTRATTWGESEVDDPIFEGETCSVHEPLSYGSYIYSWPSKYDQVFWPLIDPHGIWFCEKSGFTAFIGDFSELSASEVTKIRAFLLENPPKDSSIQTKLSLLKEIYSFRNTDTAFNNLLLRVLARWYQNLEEFDKANAYRREAFSAIQLRLKGELDEYQRLEYLYLAANYSRQSGDEDASDKYISELIQLISSVDSTESESAKDLAQYLKELYPDTNYIQEGGMLDPELPEQRD